MAQKIETLTEKRAIEIAQKPYEERNWGEIQHALQSPTPLAMIEWFGTDVRKDNQGSHTALALGYVDVRFMQKRLDEVVGMFNWQSQVKFEGGLLLVGIGIRAPKSGMGFIWKYDTGQEKADIADSAGFGGGKGVFSTSFKRTCYQWGIARDMYDLPKPRVRCRAYLNKKTNKLQFSGWIDQPIATMPESTETGRPHRTQVDDLTDHMPANANTYYIIAYTKLKYDRETAIAILQNFTDETSGEIDYDRAIRAVEQELPIDQRAYTKQESLAKGDDNAPSG